MNSSLNKIYFSHLMVVVALAIAGCSNGSGTAAAGTPSTGGSSGTSVAAPGIVIALTDPVSGTSTTSTPANVSATLTDANGAIVKNAVVTFSVANTSLASITPSTATALTNNNGVASVSLTNAGIASGATTITASAQAGSPAVAYTTTMGFSVGATTVAVSTPVFGVGALPLSAYGTTSVSVTVTSAGVPVTTPQSVSFTSSCVASGKATITASTTTVNGVATASYKDNGCAGSDTVTASVSGMASSSATIAVAAPVAGSLQFVSASPISLSLKGVGGIEASTVTFRVLDANGNPIQGKTVDCSLTTTIGGIALTPAPISPAVTSSVTSDAYGYATVSVNSGVVSTPVRVIATSSGLGGAILSSQSSALTITTGIPDQSSFSLSATKHNIEGWGVDGNTTVLTARLSDHFSNPVPDNTVVNFTSEGGQILSSCQTSAGACSTTLTSANFRPSNGRVTVLAWALGNESFTDLNGNGVADISPNELIDANNNSTDMSEAFVDYNENGVRDAGEPFFDLNGNNAFDGPDGKYSGILCNSSSSAGTCSTQQIIDVRSSSIITFSSSYPAPLALFDSNDAAVGAITLPSCDTLSANNSNPAQTYYIRLVDVNGNAMPVGTTIGISSTNGTVLSTASFVVPDTAGCSSAFSGCPASVGNAAFQKYPITLQSDAQFASGTCTNTISSGIMTITVTTPGGVNSPTTTTTGFSVND
ncbi:MAG: hypothetical protein PHQ60_02125 [Sideroxydans sp.]|nr:hypothetical protein [Sideroxydans sp.]MDD5056640.1 hypothetical protein [Sideroxydans sp.]